MQTFCLSFEVTAGLTAIIFRCGSISITDLYSQKLTQILLTSMVSTWSSGHAYAIKEATLRLHDSENLVTVK